MNPEEQDQSNGSSFMGDVGRGIGVEAVSTVAEQGGTMLGGAGIAWGIGQILKNKAPGVATKSGVMQHSLLKGFKLAYANPKIAALNLGINLGGAAIGGIGLHMIKSNTPHNKIDSNEAINGHPMVSSAIGGALMGGGFVGLPAMLGFKEFGKGIQEVAGSDGISNYLSKRREQIYNNSKLSPEVKGAEQARIDRYSDMRKAAAESPEGAINVAKQVRSGLLGHNKFAEKVFNKTDKAFSKVYHMKGRGAALMGGSMLLGAVAGAAYNGAQSGGGE